MRARHDHLLRYSATVALLAAVSSTPAQPLMAQQALQPPPQSEADDIVVTATKRETSLQTTSLAISVVGANDISTRHLGGANDYLAGLPGVSYQDRGAGANTITIRGIGSGSQSDPNSPVGTYFGETPLNGLGAQLNGNQAGNSDVKLVDIKQIEVLRGPQGTLYGSGTMGGTVRVIPNAPNLHDVEGGVQGEYSSTAHFGGNNYKLQGVINLPVIDDKLAIRGVAYRFFDDGYVKNIAGSRPSPNDLATKLLVPGLALRDRDHVGSLTTTGARGSLLARPTDRFSLQLMYLYQADKNNGMVSTDVNLGDYNQARAGTGPNGVNGEFVSTKLRLTNIVAQYDLGFGTLLNSTSFISSKGKSDIELTFYSSDIFAGEDAPNSNEKNVFVNEMRFTSNFKGPFQFIAGTYYENRRVYFNQNVIYQYPTPIPPGNITDIYYHKDFQRQLAFFGEASLKLLNDKLTLTGGGRYFKFDVGIPYEFDGGETTANQGRRSKINGTNWKGNISYEFSKDLFIYGLFSEGFRAPKVQNPVHYELYDPDGNGLINFADGVERKVPEGLLDPDKTKNYEAGAKFRLLDGRLRGSLTGYIIDWTGIPLIPALTIGGSSYYINAGKARSKGVEFEASARLPAQIDLSGSISYTDSVLAETQSGLGVKGTRLPGSAKWNAHGALQKNFAIATHDSFVRVDYTWVGKYFSDFTESPPAAGGYGLVDLSGGITINKINLGIFAKNIMNSKAATWYDNYFTTRAYRLRPRTIGMRAGIQF